MIFLGAFKRIDCLRWSIQATVLVMYNGGCPWLYFGTGSLPEFNCCYLDSIPLKN